MADRLSRVGTVRAPEIDKLSQLRDELRASLETDHPGHHLRLADRLRREQILRQVESAIIRLERRRG